MIDPEFWLDEDLASLTPYARLLFIGTWNICDDNYATFPNKPGWLKIQIFPYEDIDIPPLLSELSRSNKVVPFTGRDGHSYFYIKNFFKYQTINRPSSPKYEPYIDPLSEGSVSTHSEVKEVKLSKLNKETVFKNSRETLKANWGTKRLPVDK